MYFLRLAWGVATFSHGVTTFSHGVTTFSHGVATFLHGVATFWNVDEPTAIESKIFRSVDLHRLELNTIRVCIQLKIHGLTFQVHC